MQKRYILLLAVIVIGIFVYTGNRNVEQTVSIGGCSAKFSNQPVTVASDLCSGNRTCTAQPYEQQNNAVVDAVLCACGNAKSSDYSDAQLNSRIQEVVSSFYGYSLTAREICEQQALLVKRNYG